MEPPRKYQDSQSGKPIVSICPYLQRCNWPAYDLKNLALIGLLVDGLETRSVIGHVHKATGVQAKCTYYSIDIGKLQQESGVQGSHARTSYCSRSTAYAVVAKDSKAKIRGVCGVGCSMQRFFSLFSLPSPGSASISSHSTVGVAPKPIPPSFNSYVAGQVKRREYLGTGSTVGTRVTAIAKSERFLYVPVVCSRRNFLSLACYTRRESPDDNATAS